MILCVYGYLTLALVGCDSTIPTGSDFFPSAVITEYYLDAQFATEIDENTYFEVFNRNGTEFTILNELSSLSIVLDNYSHLNIDRTSISDISECTNEYCTYLLIPMYSEGDFEGLNYEYRYSEGKLCIYAGPSPSNEDERTIKVIVLQIDAELPYEVTNDMSMCPYYK